MYERSGFDLPADVRRVTGRLTVFSDIATHCCQASSSWVQQNGMSLTIVDDHEFCGVMSDKSKRFSIFTSSFEVCCGRIMGSTTKVWDDGNNCRRGTGVTW